MPDHPGQGVGWSWVCLTDERLRQLRDDPYVCVDDRTRTMAAQLLAARARVAELEAQQAPAGYLVGWRDDDRTLLALDVQEVGILGDRARAYSDLAEACSYLAEVGPEDPATEFRVYALREVRADV